MAKGKNTNDDKPNDGAENFNESDDTFGLPDIEYQPLNRESQTEHEEGNSSTSSSEEASTTYEHEPTYHEEPMNQHEGSSMEGSQEDYQYRYEDEQPSPVWPKALLIVFLFLAVVGGGLWYYFIYRPQQEADRIALEEQATRDALARKNKLREDSIANIEAERKRRLEDSLAQANAKPAIGNIEILSERTKLYYVVIASAVDDDLLMDHAKKLSHKGVSSKIIPPFGKTEFYRLTIAQGDTYSDAQAKADELKGDYGNAVWVVRY